jgi:23S rRNA pseudouridine1911/1915/1917 synthase
LDTGRTHQIRVHLSYLGFPICGDILYGKESSLIKRQALHAHQLTLHQPRTGTPLHFEAKLPFDFKHMLDSLDNQ